MSSSRKGNNTKKAQKYQNAWAYKPGLYKSGKQRAQNVAAVPLAGLCTRCREKIEWKKKYDKYKPLTGPRKCTVCGEHKVKQAYYHICRECSEERGMCSKCGKSGEAVESYPPTAMEREREEEMFRAELRHLRERERRKRPRDMLSLLLRSTSAPRGQREPEGRPAEEEGMDKPRGGGDEAGAASSSMSVGLRLDAGETAAEDEECEDWTGTDKIT